MSLPQSPFTSLSIPSKNKSLSSNKRGKCMLGADQFEKVDWISTLPDHVLLMILMRVSTEKAVQTSALSKRWMGVWKQMPYLRFDMINTAKLKKEPLADRSVFIAQLITKVIKNHYGHLESCRIQHFSFQSKDGTLETWIRSLIHVKQTKSLELVNLRGQRRRGSVIRLSPNIFSHPALTSLFMFRYDFESAHAFNNCNNLLILKLDKICAEVGLFNKIIACCPSLKVLVLDITWYSQVGCLKIHNNKLKVLHLACTYIDSIEVFTELLDIFSVYCCFLKKNNFFLEAPRICQFRQFVSDGKIPPIYYNISCNDQEKENIGHEFVVSRNSYYVAHFRSLAVNVDLMNPREVYMLKKVLDSWTVKMKRLEIIFKHNNAPKEEGGSSSGSQEKKLTETCFFPNADFRVNVVRMYNFSGSNEEECALASLFVTQKMVTKKLMIKTSSIVANKKLEIEAAVAKLMKLPKGNKELSIEYF